jgi:hypothetical protein
MSEIVDRLLEKLTYFLGSGAALCRIFSYLEIGKGLLARFQMLPATYVLIMGYYVSSTVAMVRSGHFSHWVFPKSSPYCKPT